MSTEFWSYIHLAKRLALLRRKSGMGNQFRHQMDVFATLLDFGYRDSVLLKAALIHDIIEDGPKVGYDQFDEISRLDPEGEAVLQLVKEVSIRTDLNGIKEPKREFLLRIMQQGSDRARIIKIADRIANVSDLWYVQLDPVFIERYLQETRSYIMPYARQVDGKMADELESIIEVRS